MNLLGYLINFSNTNDRLSSSLVAKVFYLNKKYCVKPFSNSVSGLYYIYIFLMDLLSVR